MTLTQRATLLAAIAGAQENTASVAVQIGHTDTAGMVRHDSVVILDELTGGLGSWSPLGRRRRTSRPDCSPGQ
jgi:hypothetical protein